MTDPFDLAFSADNEGTWDAGLTSGTEVVVVGPVFVIESESVLDHVVPRSTRARIFSEESTNGFFIFASHTNEDDVVFVLVLQFAQMWHTRQAGAAPRRPELNNVDLVLEWCFDRIAFDPFGNFKTGTLITDLECLSGCLIRGQKADG